MRTSGIAIVETDNLAQGWSEEFDWVDHARAPASGGGRYPPPSKSLVAYT